MGNGLHQRWSESERKLRRGKAGEIEFVGHRPGYSLRAGDLPRRTTGCDNRGLTRMFLTLRSAPGGIISMKCPSNFPIRAIATIAVFVLYLAAATATTTDVIFSCEEDEGEYADTDLETDSAGNIYGTTVLGGDFGSGTVFQLSPTTNGWVHTVLYSFTGGADGGEPYKGVTLDREGNLYGTAVTGGSGSCEGGCGVVYKLTPRGEQWDFRTIYSFKGQVDGSFPYGALLFDASGNIFGTTYYGGANNIGAVYELSRRPIGEWEEKVLYSFRDGANGS